VPPRLGFVQYGSYTQFLATLPLDPVFSSGGGGAAHDAQTSPTDSSNQRIAEVAASASAASARVVPFNAAR
jgi:hypothetical protein